MDYFLLEHTGELCIIILRRKKGNRSPYITKWIPNDIIQNGSSDDVRHRKQFNYSCIDKMDS
jgi:hypothetical protein